MKSLLTAIVLAALLPAVALSQTGRPAADPLAVKPVEPQEQRVEAETIRTKMEQAGYSEIADLARDSMGVWRARGKKGNELVELMVDKGGRVKIAPR